MSAIPPKSPGKKAKLGWLVIVAAAVAYVLYEFLSAIGAV
jgi:hypothetical protein